MWTRKETSTNYLNRRSLSDSCATMYALDLIGGRWKMQILCKLEISRLRFSELKKIIPNISERMLALQLRELERDHLITRNASSALPVKVEYALSEAGHRLIPVWNALGKWGEAHRTAYLAGDNNPAYTGTISYPLT